MVEVLEAVGEDPLRRPVQRLPRDGRGYEISCPGIGVPEQTLVSGRDVMPHHPEHRTPRLAAIPHDGVDELRQALTRRHLPEDVHPIRDPGIGDPGYSGMGSDDYVLKRSTIFVETAEPDLICYTGLFEEVGDGMLKRVRPRQLDALHPVVVIDLVLKLLQAGVEVARGHHRLHMVNQDRIAPPFGNRPLGRVVGVVDIEVRDGPDGDIGVAGIGEGDRLSREELESPVRADMDDHVRTKRLLDVAVGCEVLVGRRDFRIVEDLADLTIALRSSAPAFWLDAYDRIPIAHAGDDDLSLVDHRFTGRLPPRLNDAGSDCGGQGLKPGGVLVRLYESKGTPLSDDLGDRRPAEIADRFSVHDIIDQGLPALRALDRIPRIMHRLKDPHNALQRIEVRPGPDRRLGGCTGLVVEDEGDPPLAGRLLRKVDPPPDPGHEPLQPLIHGDVLLAVGLSRLPAPGRTDRHHGDPAEELRHRDIPRDVAPTHAVSTLPPFGLCPVVEYEGMEDRHAEPFKRSRERFSVTGRRERPCIDERRDPPLKERLHNVPGGSRPDLLIGDPEAEYREDVVVFLKASDQGILNGEVPVRPAGPGEEEPDADGVPGGVPGDVCVGVIKDALRIRVVGPLPVGLQRGVVRDVHTADLCLNVADQVLDILRPSIEEVGVHGRDDAERDGRGRPPGIGVAKCNDGDPSLKAADDLIPDGVA